VTSSPVGDPLAVRPVARGGHEGHRVVPAVGRQRGRAGARRGLVLHRPVLASRVRVGVPPLAPGRPLGRVGRPPARGRRRIPVDRRPGQAAPPPRGSRHRVGQVRRGPGPGRVRATQAVVAGGQRIVGALHVRTGHRPRDLGIRAAAPIVRSGRHVQAIRAAVPIVRGPRDRGVRAAAPVVRAAIVGPPRTGPAAHRRASARAALPGTPAALGRPVVAGGNVPRVRIPVRVTRARRGPTPGRPVRSALRIP